MKASELRQSILQAAVQGKLVPQDLHDEPASELLVRIHMEKAKLIEEGKIKKARPLPPITEDEIPYDLPDGWIWCKLGEICLKLTDGAHATPRYVDSGVPFLSVKDISSGKIDFSATKCITQDDHDELYKRCDPQKGDILLTKVGTTGIPVIVDTDQTFSLFVSVALLKFSRYNCNINYIQHLLRSPLVYHQAQENTRGVGNKNWVLTAIANTLIVLPPLAEQQRIVAKVNELMALCDELEAAENELETLETHFIEYLPKSILQMAVQGKLVPQDLHDEPATELLERIRAEKAGLIKEGKLKKEKPLPPITEDEIPYELPEGWVWCRLGELLQYAENNNIHKTLPGGTLINYVDIDSIDNKNYCIKEAKVIPVSKLSSRARRVLEKDYIVYSLVRPYLNNIALITENKENYIGSTGFAVFKPIYIEVNYLINYLLSPFVEMYFLSILSGFNSPSVSQTDFQKTLFPLPPLVEQQRIVEKTDKLLLLCKELRAAKSLHTSIDESNVVLFPHTAEPEEIDIAARGGAEGLPQEALDDLAELFGDGKDD